MKQKIVSLLVLLVAQLFVFQSAQAFPDRPVKLVVPTPAGGPPDIMARLLSDKMGAALGQPVIVENRPGGAGGTIGAKSVLTAEPDGYTLLMGSTSAVIIAPLVHKTAGYTSATFAPVAGISEATEVLALHPSVQANTVAEFIKLAKAQPGMFRFASAGTGGLPHLEGELLKTRAQIDISHVPYRGGGPALTGLLGGEVHCFSRLWSTCFRMFGRGSSVGWLSRAKPAAHWRRIFRPWWKAASISSSPCRSISSSRLRARRFPSGSGSPKRSTVRWQPMRSSRLSQKSAPLRDRRRRSSLRLIWLSTTLAGLGSLRQQRCRLIDGRGGASNASSVT